MKRISGIVKSDSGGSLDYVNVFIKGTSYFCHTDQNGEFSLEIPSGKYQLVFSLMGYIPHEVDTELLSERRGRIEVFLKEDSKLLSEVTIVGRSQGQEIKESGFAVNVIDTEKAAIQSIQTTELLDRIAGVRIRQSGGMGSEAEYNINGLSGNSVRIFIDGIPIRNYGRSFSLSSIPPSQIERIEVYKGVVPTYLSEDALGGAINVVLKKSKTTDKKLSTSYSYGSFNTHQATVNGSIHHAKTGFTADISGFYNYTDNSYKVWGEKVYISNESTNWKKNYVTAKRFHDSYESYGINGNAGFVNTSWADRMTVGFLFSDMGKDIQHGATMEIVYGNRRTTQDTKMGNFRYDKRNLFVKGLDLNAFASYTHSNRHVIDTIPDKYNWLGEKTGYQWSGGSEQGSNPTLANNQEKTIAGRANLAYSLHPQHRISANYFHNSFIRDVEDPLLPQAEQELTETRYLTKQILGAVYENNFWNKRLKTSLFFKHYIQSVKLKDPVKSNNVLTSLEYDKSINHNGYGATASFAIIPKIQLQASYEKALRMPGSNELLGNTSENITATYDLLPESSHNINIGTLIGPFDINTHQLMADVNFFIRDIRDMIVRGEENSTSATYGYVNLGKVISKGFDTELSYSYRKKLFTTLNLSLFNARFNQQYYTDSDGNKKEYAYYKDRLRNAPYFTMNASAEYIASNLLQKGSRTVFNYYYGYVHEFYVRWESIGGNGKATVPTQSTHDAGVSYTFPDDKITLSFNAKNLFDEQVFDNWALQKPGRSFYGKLTFNIF